MCDAIGPGPGIAGALRARWRGASWTWVRRNPRTTYPGLLACPDARLLDRLDRWAHWPGTFEKNSFGRRPTTRGPERHPRRRADCLRIVRRPWPRSARRRSVFRASLYDSVAICQGNKWQLMAITGHQKAEVLARPWVAAGRKRATFFWGPVWPRRREQADLLAGGYGSAPLGGTVRTISSRVGNRHRVHGLPECTGARSSCGSPCV